MFLVFFNALGGVPWNIQILTPAEFLELFGNLRKGENAKTQKTSKAFFRGNNF